MVKHYELMGAIIIQNTTLGATTIQTTTGEFSKGPLIQNLRCKMYLGMDTSERKREREGRRTESQHRLLWSCSQHLGILPLTQDAVHKYDLERGSPLRKRGKVKTEDWTEH